MGFAKPCLDCGQLTRIGNRCEKHQIIADANYQGAKAARAHYKGNYKTRAKAVRDNAIVCWLCGELFTDRSQIQADHVEPSNPDSILMPAHAICNAKRGNKSIK